MHISVLSENDVEISERENYCIYGRNPELVALPCDCSITHSFKRRREMRLEHIIN